MGNKHTAKEGIDKLLTKKEMIIDYFQRSKMENNYMGLLCCKVRIPGNTIKRNSTFYLFNIEGFFDIEKGVYLSLLSLLEGLAILTECKIKIDSYDSMEKYLNILCTTLNFVTKIVNSQLNKKVIEKEKSEKNNCKSQNFQLENNKKNINIQRESDNIKNKSLKKNYSYNSINRKERNSINILNSKNTNLINVYGNKVNNGKLKRSLSIRDLKEQNSSKDKKVFDSIINFLKQNRLINGFIEMPTIEKIRMFSYALDLIKYVIPCQDLVSYIQTSITLINDGVNFALGVTDLVKGIQKKNPGLIILGTLNMIINGIDLGITLKNQYQKAKTKKLTKSQNNFQILLNEMDAMFRNLIKNKLADLYDKNIIIITIDEKNKNIFNSDEGVDLRIINIRELSKYAEYLNPNDIEREKYLQNIILFHQKIALKIENLNIKSQFKKEKGESIKENEDHLSNIKMATALLLNTKKEVIENPKYNNKNFWINATEDSLDEIINSQIKIYDEKNV